MKPEAFFASLAAEATQGVYASLPMETNPFSRSVSRVLATVAVASKYVGFALLLFSSLPAENLYNGIVLPSPWPPRASSLSTEPRSTAFKGTTPDVIPIDVGRQLFVDDFLIEKTDLQRRFHAAEYYSNNPVLRPDKPWEQINYPLWNNLNLPAPVAAPSGDGVWWDPKDRRFKFWYLCGHPYYTCYATSRDGLHWDKPSLDVETGTNIVQARIGISSTIWLDDDDPDPKRRYKRFATKFYGESRLGFFHSPDGIHWTDDVTQVWALARDRTAVSYNTAREEHAARTLLGRAGERSTAFYNPFRRVWVASIQSIDGVLATPMTAEDKNMGRHRYYHEGRTPEEAIGYRPGDPVRWIGADGSDMPRPDLNVKPNLYALDAVAYESIMLGLFAVWRGQPPDRPKMNELFSGCSRDGFHWVRPSREPFIPVSERAGDWNWGNIQSAGGLCLIAGDRLYFYVSGDAGVKGTPRSGVSQTGLATLRRDGFASMEAAQQEGTLTTRPVQFKGKYLFVNVAAPKGELRAEVLDRQGNVIAPFSRDNCEPVRTDTTLGEVKWKGAADLSALAGKPVVFRFSVRRGALYAFWVSPETNGASYGYVAAGGPGFTGKIDTVGTAAYGKSK